MLFLKKSKPVITVVAGSECSGRSTFIKQIVSQNEKIVKDYPLPSSIKFDKNIESDEETKKALRFLDNEVKLLKKGQLHFTINRLLKRNFIFETDYNAILHPFSLKYKKILFYIYTDSETAVQRTAKKYENISFARFDTEAFLEQYASNLYWLFRTYIVFDEWYIVDGKKDFTHPTFLFSSNKDQQTDPLFQEWIEINKKNIAPYLKKSAYGD